MELGLLAAQNASPASLKPAHLATITRAQTGLARLETLLSIARLEDSGIRTRISAEAEHIRVHCDMHHMARHPFICFAEWLNLQGIISIVQSVAGPAWRLSEMTFVSPFAPSEVVRKAFPDTRIRCGQPSTSILIDRLDLARSTNSGAQVPHGDAMLLLSEVISEANTEELTFAGLLRRIIQPYLNGGQPDLALTAEMVGMNTRTLQRRLRQNGLSFSQILQEARFDLARTHLDDPETRIIDVAMTAGYDNLQHFTRAFRRFTGVTPTLYRQYLTKGVVAQRTMTPSVWPAN